MVISHHYFTFPLYIPRIIGLFRNWPLYLFNYLGRRIHPARYLFRNGFQLIDPVGTLAGTIAVVFVRREYGNLSNFRVIVDIGANMGTFAVYAAWISAKAKIYCFEPEVNNFNYLKRNININSLERRVSSFRTAVTAKSGKRRIGLNDSPEHSFFKDAPNGRYETVDCITLRDIYDLLDLSQIDLLKLNCEGAEYEILESFRASDFERIRNIRLEYHNLSNIRRTGEYLINLLKRHGYTIQRFSKYRKESGFIWASQGRQ